MVAPLAVFSALGKVFNTVKGAAGKKMLEFTKGVGNMAKDVASSGINGIMNSLNRVIAPIVSFLKPILDRVGMFGKILTATLAPALSKITEIFFSPQAIGAMKQMAENLAEFLIPIIDVLRETIQDLIDSGVFQRASEAIMGALKPAFEAIAEIIRRIAESGILEKLIDLGVQIFVMLTDLFVGILNALIESGLLDELIQFFIMIVDAISMFITWLVDSGVIDAILEVIFVIFEALAWVLDNLDEIWAGIVEGFTWFVNVIIGIVNFFIDIINALAEFFTLGTFESIPHIQTLQTGGMIKETGVAIVDRGEQVMTAQTVTMMRDLLGDMETGIPQQPSRVINNNIQAVVLDQQAAKTLARVTAQQQWLVES